MNTNCDMGYIFFKVVDRPQLEQYCKCVCSVYLPLKISSHRLMYILSFQSSAALWHHYEHREAYQKLLEDIAVLHRLAARLSSRAEMVGAVRQVKIF